MRKYHNGCQKNNQNWIQFLNKHCQKIITWQLDHNKRIKYLENKPNRPEDVFESVLTLARKPDKHESKQTDSENSNMDDDDQSEAASENSNQEMTQIINLLTIKNQMNQHLPNTRKRMERA